MTIDNVIDHYYLIKMKLNSFYRNLAREWSNWKKSQRRFSKSVLTLQTMRKKNIKVWSNALDRYKRALNQLIMTENTSYIIYSDSVIFCSKKSIMLSVFIVHALLIQFDF